MVPRCKSENLESATNVSEDRSAGIRRRLFPWPLTIGISHRAWLGTIAANGVFLFAGSVSGIITARVLRAEGRGVLTALLLWPQILVSIASLSINEAVVQQLGNPPKSRESCKATALCITIILSAITFLILVPFVLYSSFAGNSRWSEAGKLYILISVPVTLVFQTLNGVDQGEENFRRYNLYRTLAPCLYMLCLSILAITNLLDVGTALGANLLGTLVTTALRVLRAPAFSLRLATFSDLRAQLRYAASFHGTTLLIAASTQIDRIVVAWALPYAEIGHYAVAYTIASSGITLVSLAFQALVFPGMARRLTPESRRAYVIKSTRYACLGLVLSAIPLMLLLPWLVPALFGQEFRPASSVAEFLVIAFVATGVRQVQMRMLRGAGEARPTLVVEILSLCVFLATVVPLAKHYGMNGIACAAIAASVVSSVYSFSYIKSKFGIQLSEYILPKVLLADSVALAKSGE